MLLDKSTELALAQAVTATAMSTNVIDIGGARNIGAGDKDLTLFIKVGAAVIATGSATVNFQLQGSAASDMSSPNTLIDSGAIPKASLTAGAVLKFKLPSSASYLRYLGLNFLVATGPLTAGDFSAWIVKDVQDNTQYASGFSVQ